MPQGVSRRSFLFAAGGTILGAFAAPWDLVIADPTKAVPSVAAPPEVVIDGQIRYIMARPFWTEGVTGRFLLWAEAVRPPANVRIKYWFPETPDEVAEAEHFVAACAYRPYRTVEELAARPRLPGRFVVRHCFIHLGRFLQVTDAALLHPQVRGLQDLMASDPRDAAVLSHDQAIRLTVHLMKAYRMTTDEPDVDYLEPVKLEEAVATHDQLVADIG